LVQGVRSEEAIALLDQMPRSIQRDHLRALYQITDEEHQQAIEQLFMPSDIAEQRALQGLDHLAGLTAIRLLLRFHHDEDLRWEGLVRLMKRSLDEVSVDACEQVLSALRPLGDASRALQLAQSANRLGGSTLQQVLQAMPSFDRSKIWIYQFGDNMRAVLQGTEQISEDHNTPSPGLPSLAAVMQDKERVWRALDEAVLHSNENFASLGLAVLFRFDEKRALLAALDRWQQSDRRSAGMFFHVLQSLMLEGKLSKGLWQRDKSGSLEHIETFNAALGTTMQVSVNGHSSSEGLVPDLDQVMVLQWQDFGSALMAIWVPQRNEAVSDTMLARILWLARAPLLASVPMQYLYELVQASDIVNATKQTRLMSAGVVSDEALFLIDGQLQVLRRDAMGQESFLTTIEAGSLVGELAVLTGKPRRASLEVTSDAARLLRIQGNKLRELLARDIDVSNQLLRTVAGYVQ
jgi:Cyclic nucleotide-binding domain